MKIKNGKGKGKKKNHFTALTLITVLRPVSVTTTLKVDQCDQP